MIQIYSSTTQVLLVLAMTADSFAAMLTIRYEVLSHGLVPERKKEER
jgi:hypothetical protein